MNHTQQLSELLDTKFNDLSENSSLKQLLDEGIQKTIFGEES